MKILVFDMSDGEHLNFIGGDKVSASNADLILTLTKNDVKALKNRNGNMYDLGGVVFVIKEREYNERTDDKVQFEG